GDAKTLLLSAVQNGQSDIFLYKISTTTTTKLTNDFYDDLYPAYIVTDSATGILFSSNREADLLKKEERYLNQPFTHKQYDLFFIPSDNTSEIHRITNTPSANEIFPQPFSEEEFSFLSDVNGIFNRYTGIFRHGFDHWERKIYLQSKDQSREDSLMLPEEANVYEYVDTSLYQIVNEVFIPVHKIKGVTLQQSNYLYNVREHQIIPEKNIAIELVRQNNRILFYRLPIDSMPEFSGTFSSGWGNVVKAKYQEMKAQNDSLKAVRSVEPNPLQNKWQPPRPFDFQSEFDYDVLLFDWDSVSIRQNLMPIAAAAESGFQFRQTRVRPYFVRFSVDDVVTQVDNNIIYTRYQPFNPNNPVFFTPPPSFALKFGITDVLENHKLYGGLRLPFSNINGNSEYFITYEYLQKRLDHKYSYYRQSITQNNIAIKTNYFEADYRYPLDVLQRIGFGAAFRSDKTVFQSVDSLSLNRPNIINNWFFAKTEYVFDNTMPVMDNIFYGFRAKVFVEIHKELPFTSRTINDNYTVYFPSLNNAWLGVFGLDARHYQKIYRTLIWANRLSAGVSAGNRKLIYYLGAVDNWFISTRVDKFDRTTPINTNNNYAFQTLATPLRGFLQNARNGNAYVLLNSEIRFPLFATFRKTPIRSELIRNFMLVGFVDAGTAWEGWSFFTQGQSLFNETYSNKVATIRVKRYKTPVIMGVGGGLRTSLLGYFMKLDLAWGYDTGEFSKRPMVYFTFGYDF
ncbi:MAG: hypothetical protein RMJ53_09000, partial [Chitinophagales bacterium]|nr:hypothetical protein [Chitinophagales bacterium]MDW8274350.1 hypothetical protein [Chitinophagales bacterium]